MPRRRWMLGYGRAPARTVISRRRFARRITTRFFDRFHMSLMFTATVGTAVLMSRLLWLAGVETLALRYALAVFAAYGIFFVCVRAWVFYVTLVTPRDPGLDFPDVVPSGGGHPAGEFAGGGGHFGGGGSSGSWDPSVDEVPVLRDTGGVGSSGGGSGHGDWFSLDLDDAWILVLALLVLAASIGGAAIWVIWQAPVILPEAACEVVLASGLVGAARQGEARGWVRGVFRSTVIPFLLVFAAAMLVAWAVHRVCPPATRLIDVFRLCR